MGNTQPQDANPNPPDQDDTQKAPSSPNASSPAVPEDVESLHEEDHGEEGGKEPELTDEEKEALREKARKKKEAELAALKKKKPSKAPTDDRLPPGQRLAKGDKWPVMDLGFTPKIDLSTWKLKVFGDCVKKTMHFTLAELKELGAESFTEDFHCVTTWSKYDIEWTGISLDKVITKVNPSNEWTWLIQYGADQYSVNVPRQDVELNTSFIAYEHDSQPLDSDRGFIRIVIPHLYGWKGAKFLTELEFSSENRLGYWEKGGYHDVGDVWKEERYRPN